MIASVALAAATLATTFGQICFKYYALRRSRLMLLATVTLFGVIPPLTFFAVRGLGLGVVYVSATGLSYVLVTLLSRVLFKDRVGILHVLALGLIVSGCLLYGL